MARNYVLHFSIYNFSVSYKNQTLPKAHVGTKAPCSIYACTKFGYILEIDFQTVQIKNMHRVFPTEKNNELTKGIF